MFNSHSVSTAIAIRNLSLVIAFAGLLSGCANNKSGPYAKALPSGSTCKSIRQELRRMDGQGVPSKVEAVNAGKKVSKASRQQANRYNQLMND